MGNMTYDQAVDQAIRLKKQGLTYPKIEEHFKAIGYTSARTKKPISALAVRHMVTTREQREKKELIEEKTMELKTPTLTDTIKKIVDLGGLDEGTKLTLIEALMAKSKK